MGSRKESNSSRFRVSMGSQGFGAGGGFSPTTWEHQMRRTSRQLQVKSTPRTVTISGKIE